MRKHGPQRFAARGARVRSPGGTGRHPVVRGHAALDRCGVEWVANAIARISTVPRAPMTTADLVVAPICGGSDTTSGRAANPAMGVAFDLLVAAGGHAIFEETGE